MPTRPKAYTAFYRFQDTQTEISLVVISASMLVQIPRSRLSPPSSFSAPPVSAAKPDSELGAGRAVASEKEAEDDDRETSCALVSSSETLPLGQACGKGDENGRAEDGR